MTTIIATHTSRPIKETDFDNETWGKCQPIRIEHYWSGQPAPPARQAEVRICWSDDALHVRFVGAQRESLIVSENPRMDKKTLGLWDRDVCEIFLAPDPGNPGSYYEFEAAPTGEWVDLGLEVKATGRETDWDFASGFTVAARVADEQLFVGMRIPWSSVLPKPAGGDYWRVNVFRCVGPEAPERYLAWLPTKTPEPAFHVPEAFGTLRFEAAD